MQGKGKVVRLGDSKQPIKERADLYMEYLRRINTKGGVNFLEVNKEKEVLLHCPEA